MIENSDTKWTYQLLPSLDLACPQEKTELSKHDHGFMEWSLDKQNTDKKHHT
jgi:hypothetical protein